MERCLNLRPKAAPLRPNGAQNRHVQGQGRACVLPDLASASAGREVRRRMDEDRQMVVLTAATVMGLAVALLARFVGGIPDGAAQAALGLAYLSGGVPAAIAALRELFGRGKLDIDLLMVIAALAAASVGAALEGAVLLTLFSVSGTLEHRAMGKARRAVEALMELRPETALRLQANGAVQEVAVADLQVGDQLQLRPGARVPVDGRVIEGAGAVDESTITGEAVPVAKQPGDAVFEATVNLHGVLKMTVERALAESTVARMIALVTQAQAMKAPSETPM